MSATDPKATPVPQEERPLGWEELAPRLKTREQALYEAMRAFFTHPKVDSGCAPECAFCNAMKSFFARMG